MLMPYIYYLPREKKMKKQLMNNIQHQIIGFEHVILWLQATLAVDYGEGECGL